MKLTKNNLTKKLGVTNQEVINLITEYKDKLPILSEEGEGFCVNARDLHKELGLKDTFGTWIKNIIAMADLEKGMDYSEWFKQVATDYSIVDIENMSINKRNALSITTEYTLTMSSAKEISMLVGALPRVNKETKELSKLTRKYFITVEKILKEALKWERIRKPEREKYKEMCSELKKYFIRNLNKEPQWYDYANEADALNQICLGAKAKEIRTYIDAQDKNTRDWLEAKYNLYLDEMQQLDIMYIKMNFDKDKRYDLIRQGFKALYPDASFLIATKTIN